MPPRDYRRSSGKIRDKKRGRGGGRKGVGGIGAGIDISYIVTPPPPLLLLREDGGGIQGGLSKIMSQQYHSSGEMRGVPGSVG